MTDMRGLIWIDTRVLDQNLAARSLPRWLCIAGKRGREFPAIYASIDITGPGDFEALEAFNRPKSANDFLCNLPRRLAQLFRQFKRNGKRVFAELHMAAEWPVKGLPGRAHPRGHQQRAITWPLDEHHCLDDLALGFHPAFVPQCASVPGAQREPGGRGCDLGVRARQR